MKKFGKIALIIAFLLFLIVTIIGNIQTRKDELAVKSAIERKIQELSTPKSSQKKADRKQRVNFPIQLHSLPTQFEFKVNKRIWKLLNDPNLPSGKAAEEPVFKKIAREFSISKKDVDTISIKFSWYDQYASNKLIENMSWEEFKKLRDSVGPPK